MMRLFILIIIVSSGVQLLNSQATIRGMVIDRISKASIINPILKINEQNVVGNQDGRFETNNLNGSVVIEVKYPAYKLYRKSFDLERINTDQEITIELEEENILLDVAEVSSSRVEKPITQSPISIDVIKPSMIERLNSSVADQSIDRIPGVQIIDGQANIRGGSGYSYGAGSRVMLILDDLQILQPDAGFTNWNDLPLENVGQIEIVKGAASALYGSSAMNGIIHFRTIKPSLEPYTAITVMPKFYLKPNNDEVWWQKDGKNIGPYEFAMNIVHRKKYKKYDVSLGANYRHLESYNKNTGSTNYRLSGHIVRHFSDRLIAGIGYNLNTGNSSSFFYWNGAGSFIGDTSSQSSSKRTRFNIDPSLQYISSKHFKHRLLTRWLHVNNNNSGNQSNQSNNYFSEYQLQKRFDKIGLSIAAGVVFNFNTIDAPLYSDTIFHNNNAAVYTQLEKTLFNRVTLSAGCRYEKNTIKGPYIVDGSAVENPFKESRPVYRFGLNIELTKGTFLRASYGEGFRFPSLAEKYISTDVGGFNIIPNINLHSEYGYSNEIGIKQGYKLGRLQGFLDVAGFYSRYQDMIEFTLVVSKDFKFNYQAQNIGDTEIKGIEFSSQGLYTQGESKILYNAGITFIDPKFQAWDISGKDVPVNKQDEATRAQRNAFSSTSSNNVLKYRSKQLARLDLEYQYKKAFFGVNFSYASHVEAIDWLFELDLFVNGVKSFRQEHNYGYRLYDFRIGYELKRLTFQINLQNAFNEVYTLRPGLREAPRNLGARISWRV